MDEHAIEFPLAIPTAQQSFIYCQLNKSVKLQILLYRMIWPQNEMLIVQPFLYNKIQYPKFEAWPIAFR